jgi:hypothetical protein
MKNINIYILSALLTLAFTSCSEDFLDKGLLGEVEETDFMQNESDAILATNACYNALRTWRYNGGFPILGIMSDNMLKGSNPTDGIQILEFDNFTFTPDVGTVSAYYTTYYLAIKRTNLVIERAPAIEMDEALKARLIAEAKFMRGITYFNMVRLYGGVPLITSTNPDRIVPRASADDIYNFVLQDLEDAIADLPERSEYESADLGRATKGAAKAFLAKVHLFLADFSNTEKFALEVINSGQYSLDPDYEHVFTTDGEFGPGSIFEIGARPFGFQEGGNQYGNTQGVRGTPNKGWGFGRPSWDLLTSYEEGDPRRDASVIFLGEVLDGIEIIGDAATPDTTYNTDGTVKEIECYNQKVWTPGTTAIDSWDHNVRMMRYAEVLLMAAEALNENGNTSDALMYLNMVRERARGGNANILLDVTVTDRAQLRQLIWQERRFELALEQHRFLDLVRTGEAPSVLGPLGFQENKHELFPIPQSEIDLSEGTLEQNPNW